MAEPQPRRPWWNRKRAWVAVVLWLIAVYPVSLGPVGFARGYWQLGYNPPAFYSPILPPNRAIFRDGGDWRHVVGRWYVRCWGAGSARSPYPAVP